MAEIPAKRRKLDRPDENILNAAGFSGSAFVLQIAELLKEERLDYGSDLEGIDDILHKIKGSIENIEPHAATPVRCSNTHQGPDQS